MTDAVLRTQRQRAEAEAQKRAEAERRRRLRFQVPRRATRGAAADHGGSPSVAHHSSSPVGEKAKAARDPEGLKQASQRLRSSSDHGGWQRGQVLRP